MYKVSVKLNEIVNTITHCIGFVLSIIALVLMLIQSSDYGTASSIVGAAIFGSSLIILYAASTVYHAMTKIRIKYYLNKVDHSAIYVLIAGTYTPYTLITLEGAWGWSIFGIIWGLAFIGVMFKIFWYTQRLKKISAIAYIAMGLVVLIAIKPLIDNISLAGLLWLFAGGVSYIVGVFFYLSKKIPFAHGIFHLFCLAGSFFHFWSIYHHVLPNNLG